MLSAIPYAMIIMVILTQRVITLEKTNCSTNETVIAITVSVNTTLKVSVDVSTSGDDMQGDNGFERYKDLDGDGIVNEKDNCPFVKNPNQEDTDGDGVGDVCDVCPVIEEINVTDFSQFDQINLDPEGDFQPDPHWEVLNNGTAIRQTINSDPGLAIGMDSFKGVDFEGTFVVNDPNGDDDYVGLVFGYRNTSAFYTFMWKKGYENRWGFAAEPGLQLKLVVSETGPGVHLYNALWLTGNTPNQVALLWRDPNGVAWEEQVEYKWFLTHRPGIGLIRIKIFENNTLLIDSGEIFDHTIKEGRLGVLCFSQEGIIWKDLMYRCNETDPTFAAHRELPQTTPSPLKTTGDPHVTRNEL